METTYKPIKRQNVARVHAIVFFNNKGKWSCGHGRKMPTSGENFANEIKLIFIKKCIFPLS